MITPNLHFTTELLFSHAKNQSYMDKIYSKLEASKLCVSVCEALILLLKMGALEG